MRTHTSTESDAVQPSIVTIVIPTLASPRRADSLRRAIESVRAGNSVPLEILVVVNGARFDASLVSELEHRDDVRLERIGEASQTSALARGVSISSTPFLGFLDDDDEYLEGAVDRKLEALEAQPKAAILVANGFRSIDQRDRLALTNLADVEADPLIALLTKNWLPSCGGLYRRSQIASDLFVDLPDYLEWTWIAFRIAHEHGGVVTLDEPTFRIHTSPSSLSKSPEYLLERSRMLRRMLRQCSRPEAISLLRLHLAQALYDASLHHLQRRNVLEAWTNHLRCLRMAEGWRYWKHTAKLLGLPKRRT